MAECAAHRPVPQGERVRLQLERTMDVADYLVTLVRNTEQIARVTVGPAASPEEAEQIARRLACENPSAVIWGNFGVQVKVPHHAMVRRLADE